VRAEWDEEGWWRWAGRWWKGLPFVVGEDPVTRHCC
jgi:hypothetical protein